MRTQGPTNAVFVFVASYTLTLVCYIGLLVYYAMVRHLAR